MIETIVLSAFFGLLLGLAPLLSRRALDTPFGFGPAIALAAIVTTILPVQLVG